MKVSKWIVTTRSLACWLALGVAPAPAQQAGGMLSPPSVPSTLPGGGAIPTLPRGAQQDILQRLLDAGAGRQPGATLSVPQPVPSAPQPPLGPQPSWQATQPTPAPVIPEDPLSPVEAFFAPRLTTLSTPLRQFGYDMFRAGPGSAPLGNAFGAVPEDYVIGRDDELVLAFRGRARQTLTLRVTCESMLLLPDIAPLHAAGRTLRDLREDLQVRTQRELGGSEVFLSLGQLRQLTIFVGGEVQRPGMVALSPLSNILDALVAAGGVRKSGSLRGIRLKGPRGSRIVDLYPVIAGEALRPT